MGDCVHDILGRYVERHHEPRDILRLRHDECVECKAKCRGNSLCPCLDGSIRVRYRTKTVALCRQCSESILEHKDLKYDE
jgi:hypothetical protein